MYTCLQAGATKATSRALQEDVQVGMNDPWPPARADAGIPKSSPEHTGAKEEYAQSLTPQHQEDWQAPNQNSSERSQRHTSEEAQGVQMASTWEFSVLYP